MSPRLQAEWGARVSLDFFFGGAGAGLLGSYLLIAARDGYRGLSVAVIVTGVVLVLLGLLLLASELGRPANALRSMANPGSSWMARGAIFNLAVGYMLDHRMGYGAVFGMLSTFHVAAFAIILLVVGRIRPLEAT